MSKPESKLMTVPGVVKELKNGMTIGIGGWGSRRKPMALIREICRSSLKDLTIVSYGGPDVGMLCAAGKVKKAIYGFVSLDSIPLEPHFRKARQEGSIDFMELDEGAFYLGILAAAHRVPFYPTRAGLGSDMLKMNPELKKVQSPYEPYENLVAVPAIEMDVSLIHMNRADEFGNGQFLGPDLYFDDLFAMAGKKTYMTAEEVIPTEEFLNHGPVHSLKISRIFVDGVIPARLGAHFTECPPDYQRDEAVQKEYAASAKDENLWKDFYEKYISPDTHEAYLKVIDE